MSILIDSSVWIDFFRGHPSPEALFVRSSIGEEPFIVGDLILAEVLQGFRHQSHYERAREAMLQLPVVPLVNLELALLSARNYRLLRSRGFTIRSTIDCLIATYCITNEVPLLHSDRDFSPFEQHLGLTILHP